SETRGAPVAAGQFTVDDPARGVTVRGGIERAEFISTSGGAEGAFRHLFRGIPLRFVAGERDRHFTKAGGALILAPQREMFEIFILLPRSVVLLEFTHEGEAAAQRVPTRSARQTLPSILTALE